MNHYVENLSRIEFVVTMACTGRCRHCSEGEHTNGGPHLSGDIAEQVVRKVCEHYKIKSIMTFGGEPLLYPDTVYKANAAAKEMSVPKRQVITNGYFSKDNGRIEDVAKGLAESWVNDILLSVDAFHQETIPLEPVMSFAKAVMSRGIRLRTSPAWLVSEADRNPYNQETREILRRFSEMGINRDGGNVIFPSGNALIYLKEYFTENQPQNPYEEDPEDIRAISIGPDGTVLNGNVFETDILDILEEYEPQK